MSISAQTAQAHLDAWLQAELKLAEAQEYELETPSGRRKVRRADLKLVANQIAYWRRQVTLLGRGPRSRVSLAGFNHDYG